MKRNPLTLIIGLLLIVVFGLLLFVFQVRHPKSPSSPPSASPPGPSPSRGRISKWPWPIQKVWWFDQRVQNFEDRLTEGLTQDSFNLLTSVYVGWKVSDPAAFFPRFAGSANPIGGGGSAPGPVAGQRQDRGRGQASPGRLPLHQRQRGQLRRHRERNPGRHPVAAPAPTTSGWRSSSSASSGCNCPKASASRCSSA